MLIAKWMLCDEKWLFCLDRTHWKYGKVNINILVLSVAVEGISISLLWTMLDKQGNSNTQERKDLLLRRLFSLKEGESMVLNKTRRVWGQTVYLSCFRSADDWVIISSNDSPQTTLSTTLDDKNIISSTNKRKGL